MPKDSSIDGYRRPDSYFGSQEEEYRIAGHLAAIRLMQAIAESAELNSDVYTDKSVPFFVHAICDALLRKKLEFAELVRQWTNSPVANNERIKALETFGIVEPSTENDNRYVLKSNFELALELEFSEDPLIDEIKKLSDIGRLDTSIDFYTAFYLDDITRKRQGSRLSIDYLVPVALGNIEF